jgi:hypothetical protein
MLAAMAGIAVACLNVACSGTGPTEPPELVALPTEHTAVSYQTQVRPVLDRRCVVCHGCYDAPCQLLLSSEAGLERGASKQAVYDSSRLKAAPPTRLFIDAHTTAEWREREFFSVLGDPASADALLVQMLALGRAHPFTADTKLPAELPLNVSRKLSCPTATEFNEYASKNPFGGMPYGTAPLSDAEAGVLVAWAAQDARPVPPPPALPRRASAQVDRWEAFLNGTSMKERITGRYLYEHWVFAHLYFEDLPTGPFFRIVRSRTPPGTPIDVIASRRPYDHPGVGQFWYRLRPIRSTIVHKTHIVYPLSAARMQRLSALFLESDWTPTRFPAYGNEDGSNPFVSFDQIPARSRYQFLLDDAEYFVMTFIRGPVCRGQVAVDVIEDHFFVTFLDPDHDPSILYPELLQRTQKLLSLPGERGSRFTVRGLSRQYQRQQRRYLDIREQYYDTMDPEHRGPTLDFIWDGDGTNTNALLTVFRNFDNATVERGFLGAFPKTAWIVDFPILERIYYDLVANFDVFGNVTHQLSTRLYMDQMRMQSENTFLAFVPADRRHEIRASWYVGAKKHGNYEVNRLRATDHGTQIRYTTADVTTELLEMILARNPAVSGPPDLLNRCATPPCDRPGASAVERQAERALQPLTGVNGKWVVELPEVAYLRVRAPTGGGADATYALVHNRAHTNVASLFKEDQRLDPDNDTLTVARGYFGSYPNFIFEVDVAEIQEFARTLTAVDDAGSLEALVNRWGVRRTSPHFWSTLDWIHDDSRHRAPTRAGLFDINRYKNL